MAFCSFCLLTSPLPLSFIPVLPCTLFHWTQKLCYYITVYTLVPHIIHLPFSLPFHCPFFPSLCLLFVSPLSLSFSSPIPIIPACGGKKSETQGWLNDREWGRGPKEGMSNQFAKHLFAFRGSRVHGRAVGCIYMPMTDNWAYGRDLWWAW